MPPDPSSSPASPDAVPPSPVQRLALIGDVHANLAALDAVLAAVWAAGIRDGAVTGDLVMRGLEPEACVARIAALGWPCVAGNTDRKVARRPPRPGWDARGMRPGSRSWTRAHISEAAVRFLAGLPATVRLTLGGASVVVVHGDETIPGGLIDRDTPDADLARVGALLGADCVVSGHTHRPFVRTAGGRLFVNPGSVGEARGGDLRPSWAWLAAGPGGLRAVLERVPEPLARDRAAV